MLNAIPQAHVLLKLLQGNASSGSKIVHRFLDSGNAFLEGFALPLHVGSYGVVEHIGGGFAMLHG